jgi:hypothetical protein
MGITFVHSGSFNKTEAFLTKVSKVNILSVLKSAAQEGVNALASATPVDSRLASSSWGSQVSGGGGIYTISWTNTNIEGGFPVAIMLQYGYGTGTGGYVQGRDYINPAMRPVFDSIANKVWMAVTSA